MSSCIISKSRRTVLRTTEPGRLCDGRQYEVWLRLMPSAQDGGTCILDVMAVGGRGEAASVLCVKPGHKREALYVL